MEEKKSFNFSEIKEQVSEVVQLLNKNKLYIFILFVALTYGYIYIKMKSADSASPDIAQVQVIANPLAGTKINAQVVQQIQSLQNNSVNVQTLFQNARNNPFND